MRARLGHVFGWTGDILGGFFILGGLANYFQVISWVTTKLKGGEVVGYSRGLDPADGLKGDLARKWLDEVASERKAQLETLIALLVVGVVIFLIGQTLRYALAGLKRRAITEHKQLQTKRK